MKNICSNGEDKDQNCEKNRNKPIGSVFTREKGYGGYNTPLEWPKIGNICYFDQEI
jgi:hypothetical protein